jgi:hypothetical protein
MSGIQIYLQLSVSFRNIYGKKYEFNKLTFDISGNSAAFSGNSPEYLTMFDAYDTMQPHAAA